MALPISGRHCDRKCNHKDKKEGANTHYYLCDIVVVQREQAANLFISVERKILDRQIPPKTIKKDLLDKSENISQNSSSSVKKSSHLNIFLPYLNFQRGLLFLPFLSRTRQKSDIYCIMGSNGKFDAFYIYLLNGERFGK